MAVDHYETLGVRPDARREEIRAAYVRVMRATHPDHRPDDPSAARRARQANAAWEVLGEPTRRQAYDRLRAVRDRREDRSPDPAARRRARARAAALASGSERAHYRAMVTRSLLRFGVGTFAAGLVVLLLLA